MRPDLLILLCVSFISCHPDGQLLDTPLAQLLATAAGTTAILPQPNTPILPLAPNNFRSKRKPQNQRHRFRPRAQRPRPLSGLDQSGPGPREKSPPNPLLRSSNFAGFSRRPRPTPVSNRRPQTVEDVPEFSPTALFEPTTISPALLLQDFFGTPEPTLEPVAQQELFPAKTTSVFSLSNDIQEVNQDLLLEELRSQAAAVTGALPVGVSTSRIQEIKENRIEDEEPRLRIQDIKPRQFSIEPRQFSPSIRQFSPEPRPLVDQEPRQFIQETRRDQEPRQFLQEGRRDQEPRQFLQESRREQEPRQFLQESRRDQEPRQFVQESRREQEPRQFSQESRREQEPRQFIQESRRQENRREKPGRKLGSRKTTGRRREGGSRRNQVRPDPVEKLDVEIIDTPKFAPAPQKKPIQRRKPKKLSLKKKLNGKNVKTLDRYKYENEDGSITWGYQNEDGTFKEETIGVDCVTHGKYGYVDPVGQVREYSYTSGVRCDPETRVQIQPVNQGSAGLTGARGPNGHGYFDYNENKFIMADGRRVNVVVNNKHRRRG